MTVQNRPSGQYATIVVRSEFRVALLRPESLLASRVALTASILSSLASTGTLIPLVGLELRACQVEKFPPSKKSKQSASCWQYVNRICQKVSNSSFLTPTLDNCFGVGTRALELVLVVIFVQSQLCSGAGAASSHCLFTSDPSSNRCATTINGKALGFYNIFQKG